MNIKYITRDISLISNKKNLEHLYTFKNFPAFISYVDDTNVFGDIRADMSFGIDPDTGVIQLEKVLPLEIVYEREHSVGLGRVWEDHYSAFSQFIAKYRPKNVLEIGGGNGVLAKLCTGRDELLQWTIVEPLPLCESTERITVKKTWFNENFQCKSLYDTIIHSHVLEHFYFPNDFIKTIHKDLPIGGKHIFSIPNLQKWLKEKYINTLNFEHTIFLTEYVVDYLLNINGFTILDKEFYGDHSIFYATEKVNKKREDIFISKYVEYKELFTDFVCYYDSFVKELNNRMQQMNSKIYLFGAHVFSQFLLNRGLDEQKITGILDNAEIKQGKRLYGTSLYTYSPNIIKGDNSVVVILRASAYQQEIKHQLLQLNKNVIILEE